MHSAIARAALSGGVLVACSTPAWVPTERGGPESRACREPSRQICEPSDIWVVGSLKLLATHKDRDPVVAECDDPVKAIVVTNSCGWFKARARVREVVLGSLSAV